jgi:hypothetical protein
MREERPRVSLEGPFREGDVLTIPFDFLNVPTVGYLDGYTHYVVLDKIGWRGKRYRLRGLRGEPESLVLPLPGMVVVE